MTIQSHARRKYRRRGISAFISAYRIPALRGCARRVFDFCDSLREVGVSLRSSLDKTGFSERLISPFLLNRLEPAGRDAKHDSFIELRNVNSFLVQVKLSPDDARRVELRGASAVGIPSGALGPSLGDGTNFHSGDA